MAEERFLWGRVWTDETDMDGPGIEVYANTKTRYIYFNSRSVEVLTPGPWPPSFSLVVSSVERAYRPVIRADTREAAARAIWGPVRPKVKMLMTALYGENLYLGFDLVSYEWVVTHEQKILARLDAAEPLKSAITTVQAERDRREETSARLTRAINAAR